jgi:hypothetical protein
MLVFRISQQNNDNNKKKNKALIVIKALYTLICNRLFYP